MRCSGSAATPDPMGAVVGKILPVVLIFLFGYFLKRIHFLTKSDGDSLLKVFFNVSLPALVFLSVAKMNFTFDLLWLPVIAVLVITATFFLSNGIRGWTRLDRPSFGTFLVGSLIMNTGFTYPFFIAARGEESLAQASLFDFGNTALVFTFIYYLACKYGGNPNNLKAMVRKYVCSPPLLAVVCALIVNLNHIVLPDVAAEFFKITGYMTVPLVMLSLGIHFSPKTLIPAPVLLTIFIRMGIGLLLGFLFVAVFRLKGISREVVLIISSAPSGISTLVFSSMEDLNKEMAADVVSYSVLAGMFLVPIVLGFSS